MTRGMPCTRFQISVWINDNFLEFHERIREAPGRRRQGNVRVGARRDLSVPGRRFQPQADLCNATATWAIILEGRTGWHGISTAAKRRGFYSSAPRILPGRSGFPGKGLHRWPRSCTHVVTRKCFSIPYNLPMLQSENRMRAETTAVQRRPCNNDFAVLPVCIGESVVKPCRVGVAGSALQGRPCKPSCVNKPWSPCTLR